METLRREPLGPQPSLIVTLSQRAQHTHDRVSAAARPAARALFAGLLVGGVVIAPVLVVVALIVLFAPTPLGVRHLAPALIFASLAWLALAIFGAHAQIERDGAACDEPMNEPAVESLPE
jgi:hypothetical protein